ncbi:MAG: LacI family DNA-binding transcriptional regulator [Planctomycetota bacterium]|nr:LacI family DNA-binding transcriptional regulator [Planctomycetota bacterium]
MAKATTIQDIAKLAGVSKSTVSRVMNKTTAVHPEKAAAVIKAAEQLGFAPNQFARSLASGRSMTVGVITQNLGSPFYDAIAQGVIAGLEGTGYSPIFADGRWDRVVEEDSIRSLQGRRADGILLIGGQLRGTDLKALCGTLPRVTIARHLPSVQHCCIYVDNVQGGFLATQHLIRHGHTKIAFIGGLHHHSDAKDRLAGYRKALAQANIRFTTKLVLEGNFSSASGHAAVHTLLKSGEEFTAIFAANDATAYGARLALDQHGLRVPQDVSLVGYDNQAESAFMIPPLTTMHQPAHQMGQAAATAVLEKIQGQPIKSRVFIPELRCRESVATRT